MPPPPPCLSGWSPKCGHRPHAVSSMAEPWPRWNIRPHPGRQHWIMGSTASAAAAPGSPSAGASAERLRGDRRSSGAGLPAAGAASREAMAAARRPASAMMAALGKVPAAERSVDRERLRAPTANPRLLHVGGGVVGEVRPALPHLGRHVFGETQAAVRVEQSICSSAWT